MALVFLIEGRDRQHGAQGACEPFRAHVVATSEEAAREAVILRRNVAGREHVLCERVRPVPVPADVHVYEERLKPGETRQAGLGPWRFYLTRNGHVVTGWTPDSVKATSGFHSYAEALAAAVAMNEAV